MHSLRSPQLALCPLQPQEWRVSRANGSGISTTAIPSRWTDKTIAGKPSFLGRAIRRRC